MIYLFSQIAVSLLLASIVGGALGWIVHRARSGKQIKKLQSLVAKQQQQVSQAQTDVTMLTDDFDDLKIKSENEIRALQQDNQKIPALNQNLEKSQLLVRQLLQKHEAEMRDLSTENEKLVADAKQIEQREKTLSKLEKELELTKQRNKELAGESELEQQTELSLDNDTDENAKSATELKAANSHQHELEVDAQSKPNAKTEARSAKANSAGKKADPAETEAELRALRDQLAEDTPDKSRSDKPSVNGAAKVAAGAATGAVRSSGVGHKLSETTVDESQLEPLFDRVDQHDDLKQIFGIGPVTEKTLNKLGITSYSQLAELKQHDIEKIADALQIFPGRIERDNWVGSARTQLEEVLEDL